MSDVLNLEVESRDPAVKKAKDVRREGKLPAVFYGKGKDSQALQMDYQTFRRLYRAAGDSTLVELNIDGKTKETVLIHDFQRDPVSDDYIHVDFMGINMNEEITTNIHLEFVGVAPAVKDLGGILSVARTEVEVRCLPKDIPHHIEVDISSLTDFHLSIHVSDIVVPEGVVITNDPELTIANVSAPATEEAAGSDEGATEAGEASEGGEEKKEEGGEEGGE